MSSVAFSDHADRRIVAPYVTGWSEEQDPPVALVELPGGGIAYREEVVADRDSSGVLWFRTEFQPGQGRPEFGRVHPLRQRRTMRRLLCQVCAGPADRTENGVLWLLQDHRDDWPQWPNGMGVTEPPVCVPCVRMVVQACPALRKGAAVVRVRAFPIVGVYGLLYKSGRGRPVMVEEAFVAFEDPAIRWVRAVSLVRELRGCTIVPLSELEEE
jgi:hypothetical protein